MPQAVVTGALQRSCDTVHAWEQSFVEGTRKSIRFAAPFHKENIS